MKVIFVDYDGVLNSDQYFDKIMNQNIEGIEDQIDAETIKLLKITVEKTNAKVVACSSWRYTRNGEKLKELFAQYGIYIDKTPYLENRREMEIKQWLEEHPDTEDFVILDDEDTFYGEEMMKKLILITEGKQISSFGEGLNIKHIQQIIQRLGMKKEFQKEEDMER